MSSQLVALESIAADLGRTSRSLHRISISRPHPETDRVAHDIMLCDHCRNKSIQEPIVRPAATRRNTEVKDNSVRFSSKLCSATVPSVISQREDQMSPPEPCWRPPTHREHRYQDVNDEQYCRGHPCSEDQPARACGKLGYGIYKCLCNDNASQAAVRKIVCLK